MSEHRAGFVTLLGCPNVGKSTLLNALLGQKIAIVTPKPQTTRDRMIGVLPVDGAQLVFVDTPGVHRGRTALNRHMVQVATESLEDVDAICFVTDASCGLGKQDRAVLKLAASSGRPIIGVINKVDLVKKGKLLPLMETLHGLHDFATIIPVSSTTRDGLSPLVEELVKLMPASHPLYDAESLTDRPVRYIVAELLREQLMLALGQEVPYSVAVEITRFKQRPERSLVDIDATIHVERDSQKGIVLGKGGQQLRDASTAARLEMEKLLEQQVFLRTHVRVEPNWTKSEKGMAKLGYSRRKKK